MKNRITESQSALSSLRDIRPELPKVEFASPWGVDVLAAVRKRPFLTAIIVLGTLAAGGQYILRKVPKEYRAEAAVYVSPTYFKNVQQDREQLQISYTTLVNQQILTIRRFDILKKALRRVEAQGIQWRAPGESEEVAVARLGQQLELQYIPDSYEVLVALSGRNREWLAPIVNTITDVYLEDGKQVEVSDRSSRLAALTMEQARVGEELQRKVDLHTQLSQKLTIVNLDKAATVDNTQLAQIKQARDAAHHKRVEAEAQLKVMAAKDGTNKSLLDTMAEEASTNDPNARPLIDSLLQRRLEFQKITAGLTPQHPQRQAAEREIAEITAQITRLRKSVIEDASTRLLIKLRAEVDRARLLESELDREVDADTARVRGVARDVQTAQGVDAEIDRLRRQQSAVNGRIDELTMPTDATGYLRMFAVAQTPLEPNKSNSKKFLMVVVGAALFLGLAFAVGMDLADQRIFSPFEIKRAVGFPPVGMVMEKKAGTAAFSEEHFRRLVNGIQRGVSTQEAKSIVLTPLRHARTGSLTTDIGRVLVARGIKTAIVDANPHRADDAVAQPGSELVTLSDAFQSVLQNGDPRLPCKIEMESKGDVTPAPLISRISGILEDLERKYDVVLIDAPPLGLSADTEFLASISDIILMVVETGEATRGELIRSASLLGRIGAPSVGVIMTQVRLRKAGGALRREFKRFCSLSKSAVPETRQV